MALLKRSMRLRVCILLLVLSVLSIVPMHAVRAQAPALNVDLMAALREFPIDGLEKYAESMLSGLKQVTPNGWTSPKAGPFQLHAFLQGDAQAIVITVEGTIPPPYELVDESAAQLLGGLHITDPMFVLSLVSGSLATRELDSSMQQIIKRSYFNMDSVDLRSGFKIIARGGVNGALGQSIKMMGFPANDFIITLGRRKGLPSAPSELVGKSSASAPGDEARTLLRRAQQLKQLRDKRRAKDSGEALPKKIGRAHV